MLPSCGKTRLHQLEEHLSPGKISAARKWKLALVLGTYKSLSMFYGLREFGISSQPIDPYGWHGYKTISSKGKAIG